MYTQGSSVEVTTPPNQQRILSHIRALIQHVARPVNAPVSIHQTLLYRSSIVEQLHSGKRGEATDNRAHVPSIHRHRPPAGIQER